MPADHQIQIDLLSSRSLRAELHKSRFPWQWWGWSGQTSEKSCNLVTCDHMTAGGGWLALSSRGAQWSIIRSDPSVRLPFLSRRLLLSSSQGTPVAPCQPDTWGAVLLHGLTPPRVWMEKNGDIFCCISKEQGLQLFGFVNNFLKSGDLERLKAS